MESKMNRLEAMIHALSNNCGTSNTAQPMQIDNEHLPLRNPTSLVQHQSTYRRQNNRHVPEAGIQTSATATSNHWEVVIDLESGPSAAPGFYISQGSGEQRPKSSPDIITAGIISTETAQRYFDHYVNRLDHFPYRVLAPNTNLAQLRSKSPLLVAAICTVSALHISEGEFELCYNAFVSQCACQAFSKNNTVEDVRAFVIGALWLSDITWTLSSAAVRIATELQLHRSYYQAMQGSTIAYLNARLYYLVYACDHHASVVYGRPPLTRQCYAVRNIRNFLNCKDATEDDARLASHVLRLSLMTDVFDTFGVNTDKPLSHAEITQVRQFAASLSDLRAEWVDRFEPNVHVGNYPRKGVTLQYHFANIYICSHVFRGVNSDRDRLSEDQLTATEIRSLGCSAVASALSILKAVAEDDEVQSFFDGLPTYFDVMAAFAAVFLVKIATQFPTTLQHDRTDVYNVMESAVGTLQKVTRSMHQRHILVQVTKGIHGLLPRLAPGKSARAGRTTRSSQARQQEYQAYGGTPSSMTESMQWNLSSAEDPYFMGAYDFLLNQELETGDFPLYYLENH